MIRHGSAVLAKGMSNICLSNYMIYSSPLIAVGCFSFNISASLLLTLRTYGGGWGGWLSWLGATVVAIPMWMPWRWCYTPRDSIHHKPQTELNDFQLQIYSGLGCSCANNEVTNERQKQKKKPIMSSPPFLVHRFFQYRNMHMQLHDYLGVSNFCIFFFYLSKCWLRSQIFMICHRTLPHTRVVISHTHKMFIC